MSPLYPLMIYYSSSPECVCVCLLLRINHVRVCAARTCIMHADCFVCIQVYRFGFVSLCVVCGFRPDNLVYGQMGPSM